MDVGRTVDVNRRRKGEFLAQYDGECVRCKRPIKVGHVIARSGDKGYRHSDCRPGRVGSSR